MAGSLTPEQAKELAAKGVAARKKKSALERYAGSSRRRKMLENAVWWAANAKAGSKAPNELSRTMQEMKGSDPIKFNQLILQVLPAPPKEQAVPAVKEEDPEKVMLGESLGLLERWIEERLTEKKNAEPVQSNGSPHGVGTASDGPVSSGPDAVAS